MKISEEVLLAYVDGELDAAARAEVEAAIAVDPELARRVDQQRTLRKLLGAAYDPVLDEPVPPRLLAAAQPAPAKARVVDLAAARKSRRSAAPSGGWGWQQWGGMAACLMVGLFAGRMGWFSLPGDDIATHGGQLVARGSLAQALSTQLAGAQPADAPVKIGLSYLSRADEYCRSFTLRGAGSGGLACRRGNDWELRVLAQDPAPAAQGALRMAASPLPPAVLRVIDEQIQGSPLDAQAERAAAGKGWRR
jgi:anti-sigma factor RsiW